jgi:hypothetical protein
MGEPKQPETGLIKLKKTDKRMQYQGYAERARLKSNRFCLFHQKFIYVRAPESAGIYAKYINNPRRGKIPQKSITLRELGIRPASALRLLQSA